MDNRELMVTIWCLAYNHEPYIRQCLEGFVMQKTNFRFEAIVHDDASTDGTAAIIREYAEKYPDIIKPIFETENQYSKHDGSIRRIMNEHTHGKYIAMCEGDDYWIDPLKLQKQVDFLENNPDYVFSYTNYKTLNHKINKLKDNERKIVSGKITLYLMLHDNPIITASVCIRTCIVNAFLLEKNDYNVKMLMGDLPLWIYASKEGLAQYLDDKTTVYRLLPESASHSRLFEKTLNFIENSMNIRLYMNSLYSLGAPENQISKLCCRMTLIHMSKHSRKALKTVFLNTIRKSPTSIFDVKVIYFILKCLITK